jgi:hypothetical protein
MQRRKFLVGMGSLAAGSAAAMGTGAFSTATIEDRDFQGAVTNDNDAVLRLNPTNSPYAELNNGELRVNIQNLNQNATFTFPELFQIHNDGTRAVDITISIVNQPSDDPIDSVLGNKVGGGSTNDLQNNAITLTPGDVMWVGAAIDVGDGIGTFSGEFNVNAT